MEMSTKKDNFKNGNKRIGNFATEVEVLKQLQKQNEERFKQYETQLNKLSDDLDILKKEVTEIKTLINVLIDRFIEQTQEKLQVNSQQMNELRDRIASVEGQERISRFILSFSISVLSLLIALGVLIVKILK